MEETPGAGGVVGAVGIHSLWRNRPVAMEEATGRCRGSRLYLLLLNRDLLVLVAEETHGDRWVVEFVVSRKMMSERY